MEISPAQVQEILTVLRQHSTGIRYEPLWDKVSSFGSKVELSRAIHHLTQLQQIFKRDEFYYIVGTTPPNRSAKPVDQYPAKASPMEQPVEKNAPPAPKVTLKSSSPPTPPVKAQPPKLKEGSLPHTQGIGGAALALYRLRSYDQPLALEDVIEITGAAKTTLYAALGTLVEREYVDKDATRVRYPKFKWSGKFLYPFRKSLPDDDRLLKMSINEWKERNARRRPSGITDDPDAEAQPSSTEAPQDTPLPADGTVAAAQPITRAIDMQEQLVGGERRMVDVAKQPANSNVPTALRLIDAQIRHHEQQLEELRAIRQALSPG